MSAPDTTAGERGQAEHVIGQHSDWLPAKPTFFTANLSISRLRKGSHRLSALSCSLVLGLSFLSLAQAQTHHPCAAEHNRTSAAPSWPSLSQLTDGELRRDWTRRGWARRRGRALTLPSLWQRRRGQGLGPTGSSLGGGKVEGRQQGHGDASRLRESRCLADPGRRGEGNLGSGWPCAFRSTPAV
jgi:hypothetical protein